jgi:hypothetical protein
VGLVCGKGRPSVGNVGEWYVESQHLQGCSPHLCRLRTDGLALASKYWTCRSHAGDMGHGKSSSWLPTKNCLFPTASLAIMGEKMGMDPRIRRSSSCRLCWEPFFSGEVDLYKSVDNFMKGWYMWTTWDMYGQWSYADWAWKACGVLVELMSLIVIDVMLLNALNCLQLLYD